MFDVILLNELNIDELVSLEEKCFSSPWTKNMFLGDLKSENTCYYGAFDENYNLIGYAGMWISIDDGQITNVAVHPDFRRKGIAYSLVLNLVQACKHKNLESITLEVRESNNNAISLYEKLGFERVGLRKNYYKNPSENAILMTKTLNRKE